MENKKMKITQDALYKYLTEHDVKLSRIAELMGQAPQLVIAYFRHDKNRHGVPRVFSVENIQKLNAALPKYVGELRQHVLTFGTEQKYTNKHGRTYDPGMIEPINALGKLLNMTGLASRVLGWNKIKKTKIFSAPSSKIYGNISEDDVMAINAETLAIAGALENMEVVPEDNAYSKKSDSEDKD